MSADSTSSGPAWAKPLLLLAALYNAAWGAWVALMPNAIFELLGMPPPLYPGIWQCVGMIVGVFGVGYAIAAFDHRRHWPIVLVGLLGKVLGPVGFVVAVSRGELPWAMGWTILTNDLVWWIPFSLLLWDAMKANQSSARDDAPSIDEALRTTIDAGDGEGRTLAERSREHPLLVVFLRHAGCTFCREALSDIRAQRAAIESRGTRIVLVHMSDDDAVAPFFAEYDLADVARVADPEQRLYRAFGLARGSFFQLFGPRVFLRGLKAAILDRHGIGALQGDGLQMPGVFLVKDGRVVSASRHRTAADRPSYASIACPAPA